MVVQQTGKSLGFIAKLINYGKIFRLTFRRDFKGSRVLVSANVKLWMLRKANATVPAMFTTIAKKNENKTALIYQGKVWTFKELDQFSNRIAQTCISAGYKPGDEIALLMENRPEFVGIWMGLAKAGLTTALLNTNLKSTTLLHSISVIKTRALIYDSVLEPESIDLPGNQN